MSEGLRQLTDARHVQHFLTQVIQLQHHVVAIRTAAVARQDFLDHRTCNDVATSQVLRVRRITLHEALAMLVDQVATFTAATLGHQHAGTGDTGRVELPHLDILNRDTGTQSHTYTVTGIDQGVGGRCVDATSATSGKHGSLGTDVDSPVSMQMAMTPTTAPSWFFTRSTAYHSLRKTVSFFRLP